MTFEHQGLGPYKIYSNGEPVLTLTYFTARSTLLPNAFVWENAYILNVKETIEDYEQNWKLVQIVDLVSIWVSEVKVIVWPLSRLI